MDNTLKRTKTRDRRHTFGSFDALAGYVTGEVDPEEVKKFVEARKARSEHRVQPAAADAGAELQLAKIAKMSVESGTQDSDFYKKYTKARRDSAPVCVEDVQDDPAYEGPRLLLKDVKTDSVMAAFDAFVAKESEKAARAKARRAAAYSNIPMEFHYKPLYAKGEYDGDVHDSDSKTWHVKTKCSHCGREFEFDTRVMSRRNIRAFCSKRCQYDYCYRTKNGTNRIAHVGAEGKVKNV